MKKTQMNTTIESVKDEVARKHDYKSWEGLNYTFFVKWSAATGSDMTKVRQKYKEFENEAIELYHTRKCEEAGKRTEMQLKDLADSIALMPQPFERSREIVSSFNMYNALLEEKQSQLEAWNKLRNVKLGKETPPEKWVEMYLDYQNLLTFGNEEINGLKVELEAKGEQIEKLTKQVEFFKKAGANLSEQKNELSIESQNRYQEMLNLNLQLQEAKAEAKRLRNGNVYSRFDLERSFSAGWDKIDFEEWFKNYKPSDPTKPHLPSTGDDNTKK